MKTTYYMALTAAMVICLEANPGAGYLARLGPAPLRFQPTPKLLSEVGPLPPLAMNDPEPKLAEPVGPPAPLPLTNSAPLITFSSPLTPAPFLGPMAPVEQSLSPQTFLQFFNDAGGTNRNSDVSAAVPYQFMPPVTIPPPPSRAVYSVK